MQGVWKNMYDKDGKKQLECTDENKILYSGENKFMGILKTMCTAIDKTVDGETEQEEKNLPDSQDSSAE